MNRFYLPLFLLISITACSSGGSSGGGNDPEAPSSGAGASVPGEPEVVVTPPTGTPGEPPIQEPETPVAPDPLNIPALPSYFGTDLFTPISSDTIEGTWVMIKSINNSENSYSHTLNQYSDGERYENHSTPSKMTKVEFFHIEYSDSNSLKLSACSQRIKSHNILLMERHLGSQFIFEDDENRWEIDFRSHSTAYGTHHQWLDPGRDQPTVWLPPSYWQKASWHKHVHLIKISDDYFPPLTDLELSLSGTLDDGTVFDHQSLQSSCIYYNEYENTEAKSSTYEDKNKRYLNSAAEVNEQHHELKIFSINDDIQAIEFNRRYSDYDYEGDVTDTVSLSERLWVKTTDLSKIFSHYFNGEEADMDTGEVDITYGFSAGNFFATGTAEDEETAASANLTFSYTPE